MFRIARTVLCRVAITPCNRTVPNILNVLKTNTEPARQFSALLSLQPKVNLMDLTKHLMLPAIDNPIRTVTTCSMRKGKRKSCRAVWQRFKRLHWGGWIRTRCGRHKKMHKKSGNLKHRLRQHVFVNATQSQLLDKMVTNFWKRPKYYIDDLYEPYHERSFYLARKKPMPYPEKPLKERVPLAKLSKQFD